VALTDGLSIQLYPGWTGDPAEARYAQMLGYGGQQANGPAAQRRADLHQAEPLDGDAVRPGPARGGVQLHLAPAGRGRVRRQRHVQPAPQHPHRPGRGRVRRRVAAFRSYWTNDIEGQGKVPIVATKGGEVMRLYPEGDDGLFLAYQEFLKTEIAVAFDLSPMAWASSAT
jgi:hypothetical protein